MSDARPGILSMIIRFCLEQKLIIALLVVMIVGWGISVAPFDWDVDWLPRDPVPVDAIPDTGENQQIIFTTWPGRSPQDVEDQVTYPLTVALLGVPGVKTVRSQSMFGFSSIYVIFKEDVEFYWSRSRLLEKLNSLSAGTLPKGVSPALGPDATALGQVYWYTLEGRDPQGNPAGGWGLDELRSIQDWYVRYALMSVDGVAEVASIGGFVREYQIDVDPDAMRAHGVTLEQIFKAVRASNIDVGARTIEINRVEYMIRGLGFIKGIPDIEQAVVRVRDNVPLTVKEVATVTLGPALRRGALDKAGAEAVGGVVVVRYGDNPLAAIQNIKTKIKEISPGLSAKAVIDWTKVDTAKVKDFTRRAGFNADDQDAWVKWLRSNSDNHPAWVKLSQVTVVPFYDRTTLIYETLDTLDSALFEEILITIIVVIVMVMHLRSSLLISALLPLAVLMTFIAMKHFGVDANVVALSGIAIAIGTMVDMGVVLCENILRRLDEAPEGKSRLDVVHQATVEVGSAVLTAVATTIVSFLPVFTMMGAEGKLFKPLALTKTFALISSLIVALVIIPPVAHLIMRRRAKGLKNWVAMVLNMVIVVLVAVVLTRHWLPLGQERTMASNLSFVLVLIGGVLLLIRLFEKGYATMLRWCLRNKLLAMSAPLLLMIIGASVWLGFDRVAPMMPQGRARERLTALFPGMGKEFMPSLDEGSFLYMPTTMPHASIGEALDVLSKLDMAISSIPEVESVVGKLGRAESPLDPAPVSMIETVVNYKSEYGVDEDGNRVRQWRDHIQSPMDIWKEIEKAAKLPGTTGAPHLQPIAARRIMLQSGMRAPMGVKIKGPDLETIERVGLEIEQLLKRVPGVEADKVIADRIVGKPYLEIDIDREAIARHGLTIASVQDVIEVAIGGKTLTRTVEGRERYPVRVRYQRELRDSIETIDRVLVATPDGAQVPLAQLATIRYVRGPQAIKSEDTFLLGYVLFDKQPGLAEIDVVETAKEYLEKHLTLPPGVSYTFAGNYENQIRAQRTLAVVLPLALFVIFIILYLQFKSTATTAMVFTGILTAWAGGFVMIWLYGQPAFMDFDLFGVNMRELFQMHQINLNVAIWVGFLALFGIASDNGVIMATYLDQTFAMRKPDSVDAIRSATVEAAMRRLRPCLMTTATTLLALLPILTSTGRGSDIMVPMAIPSFGGMAVVLITIYVVPVLYCGVKEITYNLRRDD